MLFCKMCFDIHYAINPLKFMRVQRTRDDPNSDFFHHVLQCSE